MVRIPQIIGETWFNVSEKNHLTKDDLNGKVVLIDFWTYSCVNCQRTLPYLQDWWEKYKDRGFVIIGIHTPEFEFEKDPHNVEKALKDLGVTWPVVVDNDKRNWDAFAVRAWPSKYLADKKGYIVYEHVGEGNYEETEKRIQALIKQTENDDMPPLFEDEHHHGKVCFVATPELYCGHDRGKLSNQEYTENQTAHFEKPEEIPLHSFALQGDFFASGEYIESQSSEAEIFLHFTGTEVNLVASPAEERKKAVIQIMFQGQNIELDMKGYDVSEAGEVEITKPTLYNLIKSNELLDGTLTIRSIEGNFRAYAFTFSGCQDN